MKRQVEVTIQVQFVQFWGSPNIPFLNLQQPVCFFTVHPPTAFLCQIEAFSSTFMGNSSLIAKIIAQHRNEGPLFAM